MDNGHVLLREPLVSMFGGARARLVEVVLGIDDDLTVRHAARLADISPTTASHSLSALARIGLVEGRPKGNQILYRLNADHYAVPHLRGLLDAAREADADAVSLVMSTLAGVPDAIVVFGSVARGDDSPGSDIDLLVVAPDVETSRRWAERSYEVGEVLQHHLGVVVDVVVAVRPDLEAARSPFWREVLQDGRSIAGASMRDLVVEMAT